MSEQDQFRELIEAYALGALDASERAALEAHLAGGCPECTKALEEARWLVSQLAYLAPPAEPSELLKARLMRTVRAEEGAARTSAARPSGPSIPYWLWAGVAALLFLSIYSTWDARKMQKEVEDVNARATAELKKREQLEQELTEAKHEAWILTDPTTKKIDIMPSDKEMPKLEAMWHPELGIYITGAENADAQGQQSSAVVADPENTRGQTDALAHLLAGCQRENRRDGRRSAGSDGADESTGDHRGTRRWKSAADEHAHMGRRRQLGL